MSASPERLLAAADLAFNPDLALARGTLESFRPHSKEQSRTRDRILGFIAEHPRDAHERFCIPGHLTASALVLDSRREKALFTFHVKLRRWLQLGGHCDGDANLPRVALREAVEESGIRDLRIDPRPVDLDVHLIPAHSGEPEHWHLDTRFAIYAPEGAKESRSEESEKLEWFSWKDLGRIETDESVLRLARVVLGRS